MTTRALLIVVALTTIPVDGRGESLADSPPTGLDLDLQTGLARARAQLQSRDADGAARTVLRLHLAGDRFTKAQEGQLAPLSVALLRQAARIQLAAGHPEAAAQSLDGAWLLDGRRPDPEYSRLLVSWAERTWPGDKGTALYLARRASLVDPGNVAARARGEDYASNRWAKLGWSLAATSVAVAIAAIVLTVMSHNVQTSLSSAHHPRDEVDQLVARQRNLGMAAGVSWGVSAGALVSGFAVLWLGRPTHRPTAPAPLPALPESP